MKIPFTNLQVTKRGITIFDKNNNQVGFAEWIKRFTPTKQTPILEMIYNTIATEFAKLDLVIYDDKGNTIKDIEKLITLRPNKLMTSRDMMYTVAYQLHKYGNSMLYLNRDAKGKILSIDPMDLSDYEMGYGYEISDELTLIKMKRISTNETLLIDYANVVHLRLNPNDVFMGDKSQQVDTTNTLIKLYDAHLNTLLNEMLQSGEIRGVIQVGTALGGLNSSLKSGEGKTKKATEIANRIKQNDNGGILVLDAGEEFHQLASPFKTMSTAEVDKLLQMIYSFKGINQAVIDGTADENQMEIFFNKTISIIIQSFTEEMTYKVLTEQDRLKGFVIDYFRNPFEYVSITKAIQSSYLAGDKMTQNEGRRMILKLPPLPGGDVLLTNKNFTNDQKGGE